MNQDGSPPRARRRRPLLLTALGIGNILYSLLFDIFNGLSGLLYPLWAPILLRLSQQRGVAQPNAEVMLSVPVQAYMLANGAAILLLGIALFSGGVGLLQQRQWGKRISLFLARAEILWAALVFLFNVFVLFPLLASAMEPSTRAPQSGDPFMGLILRMLYPLLLLFALRSIQLEDKRE